MTILAFMKFLIVDDSSTMRKVVLNSLDHIGQSDAETFEAKDGHEAMQIIMGEDLDMVFLDWNMPGLDGLELTRLLRREDKYKTLPIVMITSVTDKVSIVQAVKTGVNDYLIKPFSEEKLSEVVLRLQSQQLLSAICTD